MFDNGKTKVKAVKPCVVQIQKKNGKVVDIQIADPKNQETLKIGTDVTVL